MSAVSPHPGARGPAGRPGAVPEPAQRERIVVAVAQSFGLDPVLVTAPTRGSPRAALARQVAMYMAHVGCGLTFATVGRLFRRDRTTVSHACRLVEDLRDDAAFDCRMTALERACCVAPEAAQGSQGGGGR